MKRPIYYDTETTGLNPSKDKIIEIAAYDAFSKKTFCSFINPKRPIPKESTMISNITDEMVKDAKTFDIVGKQFIDFCGNNSILIAHNNDAFDIHFLKEEFKNANLNMPSWHFIDTLKWARKYRPDLPKHSLQYLREIYGIAANNAHRALDDVIVLEKVFSQMINDLSFDVVLQLLKKKDQVIRMPFGKHKGKPLSAVPKSYLSWLHKNGAFDKSENLQLKQELQKANLI